jgi:proteasome activator-like protein
MRRPPRKGRNLGKDVGMSDPGNQPQDQQEQRVIVVSPAGMAVEGPPAERRDEEERSITDLVEQPAKVMRLGSMIKQLLDEVKSAPLDEASRARLATIHHRTIEELEQGLAPELVEELERLSLPFGEGGVPSEPELRIAQAQLVGWLEGLFHGIQTALFAQQMAARAQLEQMRRALPPGTITIPGPGPGPGQQQLDQQPPPGHGQYL